MSSSEGISREALTDLAQGIAALQDEIERKHLNRIGPPGWYAISSHGSLLLGAMATRHPELSPAQKEQIALQLAQAVGIKREEVSYDPAAYPDLVQIGDPMTTEDFFGAEPELAEKVFGLIGALEKDLAGSGIQMPYHRSS